jgi:hypothetical protein
MHTKKRKKRIRIRTRKTNVETNEMKWNGMGSKENTCSQHLSLAVSQFSENRDLGRVVYWSLNFEIYQIIGCGYELVFQPLKCPYSFFTLLYFTLLLFLFYSNLLLLLLLMLMLFMAMVVEE